MGATYSSYELLEAGGLFLPEWVKVRYDGELLPVESGEYIVSPDGDVCVRMGAYYVPFDEAEVVDEWGTNIRFSQLCELIAELA
ncbi:MAG: hypothetical protein ACI4WS_02630 [Oscillospiraceae bacterium]